VIRLRLPYHLRNLAGVGSEVELTVSGPVTQRAVLDELERRHPVLEGTIRDRSSRLRRPYVRFFACEEDLSNEDPDEPLPPEVADGREPYLVVGAMSGG
jgi:hypothetical protein